MSWLRLASAVALGLLATAATVRAEGCTWYYIGNGLIETSLQQSNGYYISFPTLSQSYGSFSAIASLSVLRTSFGTVDNSPINTGKIKGAIEGNVFSFVVQWNNGGGKGTYRGTIDIAGHASGSTMDEAGNSATWTMAGFACAPNVEPTVSTPESSAPPKPVKRLGKRRAPIAVKEVGGGLFTDVVPPAAPKPPAQQPAQAVATANDDVDIYKGPGGEFDRFDGFMTAGTAAPVLGHEEGWYQLKLNVPGGAGWVAEDHLTIKP